MKPLSVEEVLLATGGELLSGDRETQLVAVYTDSQKIEPDSLFVPLPGARVDGHAYIEAAFKRGAAGVLTQQPQNMPVPAAGVWIAVDHTLQALQDIARFHRCRFAVPLVAVTGSVGKTSTKDMIACVLSTVWTVLKTEGNMNSRVGLPLSLLRLDAQHQASVFEIGMSEAGEIAELSLIALPDIAVVTKIGLSHIEQLGAQENILREKMSITAGMKANGTLILNGDDPLLAAYQGRLPQKTVFYGLADGNDYRAEGVALSATGSVFTLVSPAGRLSLSLTAPGLHQVYNSLAALAVAHQLGVSPETAARGLARFQGDKMRQQILDCSGIRIIDDSYNASPDSMKAAIAVLVNLEGANRRIAVLGDMLELGSFAYSSHYDLGQELAGLGIDLVLTVGSSAAWIADGVEAAGKATRAERFSDNAGVLQRLETLLASDDAVLVKGSRGMHLEEIVAGIQRRFVQAD